MLSIGRLLRLIIDCRAGEYSIAKETIEQNLKMSHVTALVQQHHNQNNTAILYDIVTFSYRQPIF